MNAAWAAFSAWDTDPATGGGTQPTLSVAGRVDGQGYPVSAGARSITITAEAGATLVTTAHGPTSGAVTVTDDTTTTPDCTAPADEALTIKVEATKDGLTSEVTFTEQTAYGSGGKAWSTVESTDFTGTSTGTLTNGSNTIDSKTWDVTLNSATATDDANGIRVVKSTSGFCYIGRDVAAVLTDKEAPFRIVFALDDISIASAGNVGIGVFSGTTPDAATRAPSVQHRVNNASGTYNRQPLHTTGAVGGSPAYTNPGNQALAGAPTSCVLEVYGLGSLVAVRWYDGTTTIPAASDPTDVFTSTSWRIMSLATGGATAGSNPNFWNNLWASMVIGSGSAVAVSADILDYQLDEWG